MPLAQHVAQCYDEFTPRQHPCHMPGTARAQWGPSSDPTPMLWPRSQGGARRGHLQLWGMEQEGCVRHSKRVCRMNEGHRHRFDRQSVGRLKVEQAGEEAGHAGLGASAHWEGVENGHKASQRLKKKLKPQWPRNHERNRAGSYTSFHKESVRPRWLSEPGRPVTEGANYSNPINGFQEEKQRTSPPFVL